MIEQVALVSEFFNILLSIVGAIVVVYGSLQAFLSIFKAEFWGGAPKQKFALFTNAKRIYVQKLIFALDFFVAADLLKLVAEPSMDEIVLIALIVVIRTVLNYSLNQELKGKER